MKIFEILTLSEKVNLKKILSLKENSGTHSPSLNSLIELIPNLKIKVDACFLSNPYATQLFYDFLKRDLIDTNKIRDVLEFYPSQNQFIANNLSRHLGIPKNNLFIGNGAIEIIQAIIQKFTKKKIIINIPTFSSYYEFIEDNVEVLFNELKKEQNFNIDIDSYINYVIDENPDTVVLINPNNPDGNYIFKEDIKKILEALKHIETVIIDESFIHFAYESNKLELLSFQSFIKKYKNLIIIKSMSKDFGIAGVRAGYAIMDENRVGTLLKNGYLWNSNGVAEYFFNLYTNKEFWGEYKKVRIKYIIDSKSFFKELSNIKLIKAYPSKANFALIELPQQIDSDIFSSILLVKFGVYVRTCSDKIGLSKNFIRVASRSVEENNIILKSIKSLLKRYEEAGII